MHIRLGCIRAAVGSGVVLPGQPGDHQGLGEACFCDRLRLWVWTPTVQTPGQTWFSRPSRVSYRKGRR